MYPEILAWYYMGRTKPYFLVAGLQWCRSETMRHSIAAAVAARKVRVA